MLCFPSQVNLKISPPRVSVPDRNMFCADAPEQIRMAAPNHTTRLNNCPARPRADLIFVSVNFVFIVAPSLLPFGLVCSSFTEVVRKVRPEVTRKNQKTDEPRIARMSRLGTTEKLENCNGLELT